MNKLGIRILNKLNLLATLNITGTIEVNNKTFKIPILQKVGLSNLFMTEPWMVDILKLVLPLGSKGFVDVGVNIGQTLLKLRSVSSEMEYIGFEPNAQCVAYTSKLIKVNAIANTKLVPVGVSSNTSVGELRFFSDGDTDPQASIISDFRQNHTLSRIEYIPLFELSKIKEAIDLNQFSILKIDVEGAELEVIQTFYEEIKTKKPVILIEILPVNAYHNDHGLGVNRQNKIQKLLFEAGYSIYRVIKKDDVLIDLNEISEIGTHSDLNQCEYVMVPSIKKEKFENNLKQRK